MKKLLFILFFCLMGLFTFNSCSEDNDFIFINSFPYPCGWYWQPNTQYGTGQYAIGGYTNGQQTRAALTRAEIPGGTYTDFALYSWTADSVIMNEYHGVFQGNTWGYNEAVKYFDNDEDEYSFIGIIPQTVSQTLNAATNSVTVEGLTSFTTDDSGAQAGTQLGTYAEDREFLYAATTVQEGHYGEGATLSFNHGNTKVYLKFTSDNANTKIVDFTPYTPEQLYQPAVPGTETYTSKTTKFIDELVAGHEVQVAIGFYGASSPQLSATQGNPLYVGSDNTANGWLAKTWLLSIKDAVNSQFVYYKLNQVANSTSKTETNEDWTAAATNKNIFMMKLADGVNATDFANGDDAFATALKAHQTDWVGGSPVGSFWDMFAQAYADGWRVVRINVSDANANQVLVFLSSNIEKTTQVCEVTGGTPEVPYKAATGHEGIIMVPATSASGNGSDAVLVTYPATVNATVGLTGVTYTQQTTAAEVTFTTPTDPQEFTTSASRVSSPTTWYTFPAVANTISNVGYTIKFSYTYDGVLTKYDNRVYLPASECQWEEGKYYTYIINIRGKGNGKVDPTNADEDDPVVPQSDEITVTSVIVDYQSGEEHEHVIK